MVRQTTMVRVSKRVSEVPRARSSFQKKVRQKVITQIKAQELVKNILQIAPALEKRNLLAESKARSLKGLEKGRERLAIKTLVTQLVGPIQMIPIAYPHLQQVSVTPLMRSTAAAGAALAQKRRERREAVERQRTGAAAGRAVQRLERDEGAVVSSNVNTVTYDKATKHMYCSFLSGSLYEYDLKNFPDAWDYFMHIFNGDAACRTSGVSQYNGLRWYVDKSPSVGAAVWDYLRRKGVPYRRLK